MVVSSVLWTIRLGRMLFRKEVTPVERVDIEGKIKQIDENDGVGMGVAAIVFTDDERHLTPTWSVQLGETTVKYIDVHCQANTQPIEVEYSVIKDVLDFSKTS